MIDISVIIPVYNGEKWINNCMKSISVQSVFQSTKLKVEIVVTDDGSNDGSRILLDTWAQYFQGRGIKFSIIDSRITFGAGAAKNVAVKKSAGKFLCFQDIDDTMHHDRILKQWETAKMNHNALIGSRIKRNPNNSTPRLVKWTNNLSQTQMSLQIYTLNGPTLLMPTWFCHRNVYDNIGGFDEGGYGTPEDLIFFYAHLDMGGDLYRIDEELVVYTYHEDATTLSVSRAMIRKLQLQRLEKYVLPLWKQFTVWNAGKGGRRFVRSLSKDNLNKVVAFCDVDKHKIGKTVELYCPIKRAVIKSLPVLHFMDAKPPFIICVKLDLTDGQFENNLNCLNLIEGLDYILFS